MAVVSLLVDGREGREEAAGDHNQHQEEVELGLEGRYLIREIRTVGEIKLFLLLLLLLSGFCNRFGLMLLYYNCCRY